MVQPSSTTIATFPSGETPTQVMFFVVEMGSVSDVLLRMEEKTSANFCHSQTWRKTEHYIEEHLDLNPEEFPRIPCLTVSTAQNVYLLLQVEH